MRRGVTSVHQATLQWGGGHTLAAGAPPTLPPACTLAPQTPPPQLPPLHARLDRLAIYIREQQHAASLQAAAASAESAHNLASYLEFNRAHQ